jgi:uncharacterized protein (TIRG00374 family)
LSFVLLALLLKFIDPQTFVNTLLEMNVGYYAIAVLLYFISVGLLWAVRWYFIITATGAPIGLLKVIDINLVGSFFNVFLPTAVGGDVVRLYELSRQSGVGTHSAASSVLLDRLIGLISLVIMGLIALIVGFQYIAEQVIVISVLATTIGLAVGWWLLFNKRFVGKFLWVFNLPVVNRFEDSARRFYQSLYDLHRQPRLLVSTLSIALIAQVIEVISVIYIARALDLWVPATYFFIFVPVIWVITTLPLSLGGLGLREGAFAFLFGQVGLAPTEAVAISLLVYSCRLLLGLVGGLAFLRASIVEYLSKRKTSQKDLTPSLVINQD